MTITEHHLSVFAGPVRRVAQVLQMPPKIEQAPPDPGNPTTKPRSCRWTPFRLDVLIMTPMHSPYRDRNVVDVYDRLAVPIQFAVPARDLVRRVKLVSGERVLDVGTGTGAVLVAASADVGESGLRVGLDASLEMLQANRRNVRSCLVRAQAPELPFLDDSFDAVLSSFVITHFNKYEPALTDMVRVIRPGGRLGVTAWGPSTTSFADVWNEVVSRFMSLEELKQEFKSMIPWNEWFSQEANLRRALADAGLSEVHVHRHDYDVSVSTSDYLRLRELSVRGHVVQRRVGPESWAKFTHDVAEAFRDRFGERIQYSEDVHIAVGTKAVEAR